MSRSIRIVFLLVALLASACQSDSRLPEFELSGSTMGTTFSVKLVAPPESLATDSSAMASLQTQISAVLEHVENLTSTYRDSSELSKFNASAATEWVSASPELCEILAQALELSRDTNGAFDITVGPVVNLWGFGPDGDVVDPPAQHEIDAAAARVGYQQLATDCSKPAIRKENVNVYVDLSGWAKGYAVDQVAAALNAHGLVNYLVEIGGEMRASGYNAEGLDWAVAIEAPVTSGRTVQTVLRFTDLGIATSGDYRNYFEHEGERYSHTIDTRSGRPVSHALAAVTVIDRSAAFADGMATALLVLGPVAGPELAEKLGVAGFFLIRGQAGFEELTTSFFDALNIR
jgi:thiamine biosynthesis lipoprotein